LNVNCEKDCWAGRGQEVPLRRGGGEHVMVLLAVWSFLRWRATLHFTTGCVEAALALDNATCCAFDADQVAEADVVGGDVVAL
jgi:hypothetical protein